MCTFRFLLLFNVRHPFQYQREKKNFKRRRKIERNQVNVHKLLLFLRYRTIPAPPPWKIRLPCNDPLKHSHHIIEPRDKKLVKTKLVVWVCVCVLGLFLNKWKKINELKSTGRLKPFRIIGIFVYHARRLNTFRFFVTSNRCRSRHIWHFEIKISSQIVNDAFVCRLGGSFMGWYRIARAKQMIGGHLLYHFVVRCFGQRKF